ncbi:ABC transporter ATP-binding protein [bacterium]|nr:ABC transporter ATP-binding protein [bacterium]NUN44064.1 ABC transporter ATP-binding protein [bacterium]
MLSIDIKKTIETSSGHVVMEIRMEIPAHERLALTGVSGSGKTTLLRMLAGLTEPDSGRIYWQDQPWFDSEKKINHPPERRAVGFVFQDYALFPNMTIYENLAFALSEPDDEAVRRMLQLTELEGLASRRPDTLSGGQKQRVALARALIRKPVLLLMDEPLAAMDTALRKKMQQEILTLWNEAPSMMVWVSHDMAEICRLSNRVCVLDNGRMAKLGNPMDVYHDKHLSGKFRMDGEVVGMEPNDTIFILTIASGEQLIRVVATASDVASLQIGDRVTVVSKAFNPIIIKQN